MSEKIRKININVEGIRYWSEKEYQEKCEFFTLVAEKIEKYLQSVRTHDPKEIKINFTLQNCGRIDKHIMFIAHDEEQFPAPPVFELFPIKKDETPVTKKVKEIITEDVVKKFGDYARRISFRSGSLAPYSSSTLVAKEEVTSNNSLLMEVTPASTDILPEKFEESN